MKPIILETIQWTTLPEIDDVSPISKNDYAVLNEIRNVLEKHDRLQRFGVCLLHRHFDLANGEVLMEKTDTKKRVSTLEVKKTPKSSANTIETMWRFGRSTESVTLCEVVCQYWQGHPRRHIKVGR